MNEITELANLIQEEYGGEIIEDGIERGLAIFLLTNGYRKHPPQLKPLDADKIWIEFEQFLEPHTCDLVIKPYIARNAEHIKNWMISFCDDHNKGRR